MHVHYIAPVQTKASQVISYKVTTIRYIGWLREITHHQILKQLSELSDLLVKEYQPKPLQFHLADPARIK